MQAKKDQDWTDDADFWDEAWADMNARLDACPWLFYSDRASFLKRNLQLPYPLLHRLLQRRIAPTPSPRLMMSSL